MASMRFRITGAAAIILAAASQACGTSGTSGSQDGGPTENAAADAALPAYCAPSVADPIAAYGAAWNTADRAERLCLLTVAWSDDGRYVDPLVDVTGREAFADYIGRYLERVGDTRLEQFGEIFEHHGLVYLGWRIVAPDGQIVDERMDFSRRDANGRLDRVAGFFGPLPAFTDPLAEPYAGYVAAWQQPDAASRAVILADATAAAIRFVDPQNDLSGRRALDGSIVRFLGAGLGIAVTSGVDRHHEFGRFRWVATGPGGAPLEGIDLGVVQDDRLLEINGFWFP